MEEIQRFRSLSGPLAFIEKTFLVLITFFGIIFVLDIPGYVYTSIPQGQYLATFMALVLSIVFLAVPPTKSARRDRVPWYDAILSVLGLIVGLYIAVRYDEILVRMGELSPKRVVLGAIAILLVLEANRRISGWILVVVGGGFILYAAYADHMPGGFAGSSVPWPQLINYIYVDVNSFLGVPVAVAATTVMAFIFFGQVLNLTGVGDFLTEFASAAMGRYRGGPAKVAVLASSLFGTISGSAVSNVVVTGSVTIPLMKSAGYRPAVAGAVEAVSSTGGQIMPPVMGAAAFLIAQFLSIPYRDVAIAAIFPALLYYLCLYIGVDLEAARFGLRGASKSEGQARKLLASLVRGWRFIIPVASLILLLFFAGISESKAGVLAAFVGVLAGLLRPDLRNLRWVARSFEQSSRVLLEMGVIVAMAGFIIGSMQVSGLSFILSNALVNLAGGNVAALLGLTAVVALILGMGMPTTAVYILLAVLVAPALVQLGIPALSAHLFVFYFGMLSMITPPVCLAAFAAATIARASMWATGFQAMRLAGVAYVVPFMFVASPALLMRGNPADIIAAIVTAIFGTVFLAIALAGYFVRQLGWIQRLAIGICGIALILPPSVEVEISSSLPWLVNIGGVAIATPILIREWMQKEARVERRKEAEAL